MVEIREHPIRIDDLGVPYFWKHPYIHTHTHITHILKDCGATKKFGRVLRVPQLLVFMFSLIGEAALKKMKLALGEANIWASSKFYDCWLRNIQFLYEAPYISIAVPGRVLIQ